MIGLAESGAASSLQPGTLPAGKAPAGLPAAVCMLDLLKCVSQDVVDLEVLLQGGAACHAVLAAGTRSSRTHAHRLTRRALRGSQPGTVQPGLGSWTATMHTHGKVLDGRHAP